MIFKIVCILILSNIARTEAISYCCSGSNILGPNQTCSDNSNKKQLNCENSYIIRTDDKSVNFTHDEKNNLILDGKDTVPPDEYCRTTLQLKNIEVYLICTVDVVNELDNTARDICTIFELISVFFILLTVMAYLIIPDVLHLQDACILHSITGLAVAYIALSVVNLGGHIPDELCTFLAYLLYFAFMYCFFWLNVLCFHIWRDVVQPSCLENVKHWKIIYHIYGIGAPLLAVLWVLLVHFGSISSLTDIHPGIGLSRCWFKSVRETNIYFYGPVGVLLAINLIYFFWSLVELWNRSKNCPRTKILKYRLRMYVKLFFVMGITWIFEILSSVLENDTPKWIWIITDILNASQGLIIFLLLVVFRKTIKRALANRRICKWRFPAQWKNDKDSECEELDEDISLGNNVLNKPNL